MILWNIMKPAYLHGKKGQTDEEQVDNLINWT